MFEALADPTSPPGHVGACLLEDELLEYQAGRCSEAQLARLDAHLDGCANCRELVHHLLGSEPSGDDDEPASGKGWLTTFTPGSLVASRYRIRRFVGKGGMGEVYEAFDRLMAMRVALKTVLCTASDRPHAVSKLMDEVKNALRVGHPNVCRINELQEHRDPLDPDHAVPFFTMEFVDGERLGQRSKRGPLSLADARCIARQLLDGLQAAHARGVLHLDLKSDNVMLRRGKSPPEVVIMDFGLSRALDRPSRQPRQQRHELAGTLPYMSVEQLEARPALGPATDVYSFGVVLYEMLTGRLPFAASSSGALLLDQLRTRPPPPSHYVPNASAALDRFVLRCLASDPGQRFPHAGAALAALECSGSWERRSERRWRGSKLGAALGAGVLATAMALALSARREPAAAVLTGAPASGGAARAAAASNAAAASTLAATEPPRAGEPPRASAPPVAGAIAVGSSPRAHPVLPLVPPPLTSPPLASPPLVSMASEPRRPSGNAAAAAAGMPAPAPRAELPRAASSSRPPEHGSPIARREPEAPPPPDGSSAPPEAASAGDWTPRALPSSLLVPARRTPAAP